MSTLFKVALFMVSFVPVWFMIVVTHMKGIIRGDTTAWVSGVVVGVLVMILLCASVVLLKAVNVIKTRPLRAYKIKEVTREQSKTSSFLLLYILPLLIFDFKDGGSALQFSIYFVILLYLLVRNNKVYLNILFVCMGYRFYRCELQWLAELSAEPIQVTVISKVDLSEKEGATVELVTLNKPFYMNREKDGYSSVS